MVDDLGASLAMPGVRLPLECRAEYFASFYDTGTAEIVDPYAELARE